MPTPSARYPVAPPTQPLEWPKDAPARLAVLVIIGVGYGFPRQWRDAYETVLGLQDTLRTLDLPIDVLCPLPVSRILPEDPDGVPPETGDPSSDPAAMDPTRWTIPEEEWVWLDADTWAAHGDDISRWWRGPVFESACRTKDIALSIARERGPFLDVAFIHEPVWMSDNPALIPGFRHAVVGLTSTPDTHLEQGKTLSGDWDGEAWVECIGPRTSYRFLEEWKREIIPEWRAAFEQHCLRQCAAPGRDPGASSSGDNLAPKSRHL
jgi:hypothetical protein